MKTSERHKRGRPGVFIVRFEHISKVAQLFPLLIQLKML